MKKSVFFYQQDGEPLQVGKVLQNKADWYKVQDMETGAILWIPKDNVIKNHTRWELTPLTELHVLTITYKYRNVFKHNSLCTHTRVITLSMEGVKNVLANPFYRKEGKPTFKLSPYYGQATDNY